MTVRMNSRRNHYSSMPLMRMDKHKMPEPKSYSEPPVIEDETLDKPRRFRLLGFVMILLMPAFMIVTLILNRTTLNWVFIGVCLFFVILMWLLRAFTQSARGKLTLLYSLAALAVMAVIIINTPGAATQRTVSRVDSNIIFSQDNVLDTPSLTDIQEQAAAELETEPTPEPESTEIPISAAQSRLEEFMAYWALQDRESLLSLCSPAWVDQQEYPGAELFNILGLVTPTSYMVEKVYGNNTDNSRPIMIIANINNTDGSSMAKRYQVMMVRSNDNWYVNPDSLNSIGTVTEENQTFEQHSALYDNMTPSPTPSPTVNPGLQLFYNAAGRGSYYHLDPNCDSIKAEWLPLTASFTYAELDNATYRTLKPCKRCHAPEREKSVY